MLNLGPIIFGLLLGIVIGSQIKLNRDGTEFTKASFIIILVAAIVMAWQYGNFPFHTDFPISIAFASAAVGLFVGILLFARSK